LQDFDPADVRIGAFATEPAGVAYRLMSASASKAPQLLRGSEMTRWANSGLMHRSKSVLFDQLVRVGKDARWQLKAERLGRITRRSVCSSRL
jgi:hypothetical protein